MVLRSGDSSRLSKPGPPARTTESGPSLLPIPALNPAGSMTLLNRVPRNCVALGGASSLSHQPSPPVSSRGMW